MKSTHNEIEYIFYSCHENWYLNIEIKIVVNIRKAPIDIYNLCWEN